MSNIEYISYTLDEIMAVIKLFKGPSLVNMSDSEIRTHLTNMIYGSLLNTWKLNAHSFRIREAKGGHLESNISGLLAKKAPHDCYGRCNTKENSVYYAALNIETALLESNAKEGKVYQVVELSPQKGVYLNTVIIGWLDHYRRHDSPPLLLTALHGDQDQALRRLIDKTEPENATKQIVFDAFIADQFRKLVTQNEEYRVTALYSSLLFESDSFEQLLYPSVANFGGWNVAIRPNLVTKCSEICSVHLIRVDKDLGYGMYDCTVVGRGDLSGSKINWQYGDDYVSKGGESPFFRDTIRNPFSKLSYERRVEKALDSLPNGSGRKLFLYVLNVNLLDYDEPIITDEYVLNKFDDQSLSAIHVLLEVCDLDIRKDIIKNAKFFLATDRHLDLDHVEQYLQDRFCEDFAERPKTVLCSYKTHYRDWGSRYWATETRLNITVQSIDEVLKLCNV